MLVLGIDTSGEYVSIALVKEKKMLAEYTFLGLKNQLKRLIPTLDKILKEEKILPKDISLIAITVGPGSFTGLRLGISTAKTLSQSLKIPIIPVSTLESLSNNILLSSNFICPILDARRQQLYAALFKNKKREIPDLVLSPEDLLKKLKNLDDKIIFLGDGLYPYGEIIKKELKNKAIFAPENLWYIKASAVAFLGEELFQRKKIKNFLKLKPEYLRKPDIKIPKFTKR